MFIRMYIFFLSQVLLREKVVKAAAVVLVLNWQKSPSQRRRPRKIPRMQKRPLRRTKARRQLLAAKSLRQVVLKSPRRRLTGWRACWAIMAAILTPNKPLSPNITSCSAQHARILTFKPDKKNGIYLLHFQSICCCQMQKSTKNISHWWYIGMLFFSSCTCLLQR